MVASPTMKIYPKDAVITVSAIQVHQLKRFERDNQRIECEHQYRITVCTAISQLIVAEVILLTCRHIDLNSYHSSQGFPTDQIAYIWADLKIWRTVDSRTKAHHRSGGTLGPHGRGRGRVDDIDLLELTGR